jgi:predicted GNAT family acetyltransferase
MKVMIAFPPLPEAKGVPQLTQNRQFQWFSYPTFIYPMIPASAATLLKLDDFDVNFIDGIAQRWSYEQFLNHVQKEKPDLMAIETKTPVVKQHWNVINHIKEYLPEIKIALMGDHVTVLP